MAQPPTTIDRDWLPSQQHHHGGAGFHRRIMNLAAKALRIPIGCWRAWAPVLILAAMDMLKRWPKTGIRRSIILITSGIDYFRGRSFGTFSPDLDPLISRAQRQNTNVWPVYYPSAGHRGAASTLRATRKIIWKSLPKKPVESLTISGAWRRYP